MLKFQSPYFLVLLPLIIYFFLKKERRGSIEVASINTIRKKVKKSRKDLIGKYLLYSSLILMCLALARPQSVREKRNIDREGIDIVLSLDLSRSMLQEDFKPNRLEAAKKVLVKFVKGRPDDRISLVIFGGEAYTKIPLTLDHPMLIDTIQGLQMGDITSSDRTAIGMGMGVALNRLKNSQSISKVVILLTDGENNSGAMSPMAAANIARELGIKVYTVGIGARELIVNGIFGGKRVENTELDEDLLVRIADHTQGNYYRATDEKEFENIFKEIDTLEKVKIEDSSFYDRREYYPTLIRISLLLLLMGIICRYLLFIRIP